jgi:hypothetical protein
LTITPVAHGLGGARADLPLPEWLFAWGATFALIISFVALGLAQREPDLARPSFRPFPDRLGRPLTNAWVEVACGAIGASLLAVTIWSGLAGATSPRANWTPTFVYVTFWVALVAVSVLLGDVFRAFNPWRALGRVAGRLMGLVGRPPAPLLAHPGRLGYWPAALGLLAFTYLELVATSGSLPRTVAVAALIYSCATFVCMALFGVERWCERGEAFAVYFSLFGRCSPICRRGRQIGFRRPLSAW